MLLLIAATLPILPGHPAHSEPVDPVVSVIPRPARLREIPGSFRITQTTRIATGANPGLEDIAEYLRAGIEQGCGLTLNATVTNDVIPHGIHLRLGHTDPALGDEGYRLSVRTTAIVLGAPAPAGLFRGVQTLLQLLPTSDRPGVLNTVAVPCVEITDQPRYAWRGLLLDCCRHFMEPQFVKRYIDLLAQHKMNVLHWHLTEDQGWRIQIKKYPRLTEVGAWRDRNGERYGGFYTQEQIRDIVAYAASRHVTVVPEIEMPGHALAALAAYPELSCTGGPFEVGTRWGVYQDVYCAGNERTFEFLQDVLQEVIKLFPSQYIHIGGDECPKDRWKACSKCQDRIRTAGLNDEEALQSYFIRRIEKFLSSRGRRLIGWDEILEGGLPPNATVQSWRGLSGAVAAARSGHDVICSPTSHCYLDYPQSANCPAPEWMKRTTLEQVYAFEPTPPELTVEQARHILGAEGNMWTERAPQPRVDRQVFPRLCGLAEVLWSPAEARDWNDFSTRLQQHYHRLERLGVKYFISAPQCPTPAESFTDSLDVVLHNPLGRGHIHYTLDGTEPSIDSPRYTQTIHLTRTTNIRARTIVAPDHASDVADFRFVSASDR